MHLSDQILSFIRNTFSDDKQALPLHEPRFEPRDQNYVRDCIETGWVSSVGKYVDGFEKRLSEITDIPHAVATVNGTCALHACLVLVGVEVGDEVLVPALTFVATANAVHQCGAIPHFVESEESTLGVDPKKLEEYLADIAEMRGTVCFNRVTGRRIRALVPVHIYGTPCQMDPLVEIAARYHLDVIEDAAESLGSRYHNRHTGAFGKLAALSFNGNKIVTTGGGGAILTRDKTLAQHAKHLTTTAKKPHAYRFEHDYCGFNYRMPNLNAALGLSQLERFDELLEKKRRVHGAYLKNLPTGDSFYLHEPPRGSVSNFWLNVAIVNRDRLCEIGSVFDQTLAAGVSTRPAWELLHRLPMYADCPRMEMAATEELATRLICLPSSPQLAECLR